MSKMSKSERKIYKQGKRDGYLEGYTQGLHDGNPFLLLSDAMARMATTLSETIKSPAFQQALEKTRQMQTDIQLGSGCKKCPAHNTCDDAFQPHSHGCNHYDRTEDEYDAYIAEQRGLSNGTSETNNE